LPKAHGLVQLDNQRSIRQAYILFRIGATENGEEILVNIDRAPFFRSFRHSIPFL